MAILDKYGIKEVCDVTFYAYDDEDSIGAPVLFLDTLKVSTVEFAAEEATAQGGKGNAPLIVWDYGKEINVTLEDALFSAKSMAVMFGSGRVREDSISREVPATGITYKTLKYDLSLLDVENEIELGTIKYEETTKTFGFNPNGEFFDVIGDWYIDEGDLGVLDLSDGSGYDVELVSLTSAGEQYLYIEHTPTSPIVRTLQWTATSTNNTDTVAGRPTTYTGAQSKSYSVPSGGINYTTEGNVITTNFTKDETYFYTFVNPVAQLSEIEISANTFPGTYYIIGDTVARSNNSGTDEYFQLIIPKAKVTSENTITLEAEGDPSVFNLNLKVLRGKDHIMMKLVKYDIADS